MQPSLNAGARYDVFNGDADGICALHQLRLSAPAPARLVTGVKRDIALLQRVPSSAGAQVTVLDVSLAVNGADLRRLLDGGASVAYFDHHAAPEGAPDHPALRLHWDESPEVCTSLLVDRHLGGRHRGWALVAAFGDNLGGPARALARAGGLAETAVDALERLGQLINYNAYGDCVADLCIAPDQLYRALGPYADPFDFITSAPQYLALAASYEEDCGRLRALRPHWQRPGGAVYVLPAAAWARRVGGVLANRLARQQAGAAFAILSPRADGDYLVSVRSGAPAERSACGLCQQFPGGGGRKAAAGINQLPARELERFIALFGQYFALTGVAM